MTTTTITDKARAFGAAALDAFAKEFGAEPMEDTVGDWDSSAWQLHWLEMKDEGATEADYGACLAAWRKAFWNLGD